MANTIHVNLDIGLALSHVSNNAIVSPALGLAKSYTATQGTQSGLFAGGGAEYVFDHPTSLPFSLGLGASAYYVDLGHISGTQTPGSNLGLTDTLNYSMQAHNHTVLLVEPRFAYTAYPLHPYFLAGAGCAWNTLNHFTESTPPGSNAAPSTPYDNHTENSFAYALGAGVQYPLTKAVLLRLEYRYLNLGHSELGAASGQTTSDRLSSNNLTTNIIDLGLSYQF